MELVPSNSTKKLHIRKDGWTMLCGQTFSNRTVDSLNQFLDYKICLKCQKKWSEKYV